MPEAAPHATSTRACRSSIPKRVARKDPDAAPAETSAPSRPSDAPMPTETIETRPRSAVRGSCSSRPRCQIASMMRAVPCPASGRRARSPIAHTMSPAAAGTITRWSGEAASTLETNPPSARGHASRCTTRRMYRSAPAPRPDSRPVAMTSTQKRCAAPGSTRMKSRNERKKRGGAPAPALPPPTSEPFGSPARAAPLPGSARVAPSRNGGRPAPGRGAPRPVAPRSRPPSAPCSGMRGGSAIGAQGERSDARTHPAAGPGRGRGRPGTSAGEPAPDRAPGALPQLDVLAQPLEGLGGRLPHLVDGMRPEEGLRLLEVAPLDERAHPLDDAPEEHRRLCEAAADPLPVAADARPRALARRAVPEQRTHERGDVLERDLVGEPEIHAARRERGVLERREREEVAAPERGIGLLRRINLTAKR